MMGALLKLIHLKILVLTLILSSFGCNAVDSIIKNSDEHKTITEKIVQQEEEINNLKNTILLLKSSYDLFKNVEWADAQKFINSSSQVNLNKDGFSIIHNRYGAFLVTIDDIKSYGGGSKIFIKIGNIHNAVFSDITIDYSWGRAKDENLLDWLASLKSKSQKITGSLLPGRWMTVETILADYPPDKLKYLEVSMNASSIQLFN